MEQSQPLSPDAMRAKGSTVAVRLEGGIGDHILGLRLLPFVRKRFPDHKIILFSDSAGGQVQLDVARMSPYADEVYALGHNPAAIQHETMGRLENLRPQDIELLRAASIFLDAWGGTFYVAAAVALGVPFYDILASRPELKIPDPAAQMAQKLLAQFEGRSLVSMHLCKYGNMLLPHTALRQLLSAILEDENVIVLNLYQTSGDYSHWPEPHASNRRTIAMQDREICESFNRWHPRIVPMTDLPITTVAAIVQRSRYFIGVDNGIKHMAWAMNVPHTLYAPEYPADIVFALRWMPDLHRMLVANSSQAQLDAHISDVKAALKAPAQ